MAHIVPTSTLTNL